MALSSFFFRLCTLNTLYFYFCFFFLLPCFPFSTIVCSHCLVLLASYAFRSFTFFLFFLSLCNNLSFFVFLRKGFSLSFLPSFSSPFFHYLTLIHTHTHSLARTHHMQRHGMRVPCVPKQSCHWPRTTKKSVSHDRSPLASAARPRANTPTYAREGAPEGRGGWLKGGRGGKRL